MKIMVIFGTRPEAIKMCPVIKELKKQGEIECKVCLTGQHKEMLLQVMNLFKIEADYNLEIMRKNQTLSMILINIMQNLDEIMEREKPDLVLVHGDTSSSFAAGLSAFYHGIPIGHVEAGLRTYNMKSPYPEEFNRQAVDLITDLYFAPTKLARQQLIREGKKRENVFVTGNTVIDALKTTVRKDYQNEIFDWCSDSRVLLLTAHRRENVGKPMENIFEAVKKICLNYPDVKVIYPIHKNPEIRKIAKRIFSDSNQIKVIEPLDVYDFHNFMDKSYFILTDSGGIQEEAPALGKPVLVLRDTTERPEGIEAGTLKLVGTEIESIYQGASKLLEDETTYRKMSNAVNPYGDGLASKRIANIIIDYFKRK
ncbi:non-hydrolyzing UDP-N-acetylglucosamine 2-epimerase [Thermoguttaceae bacterium LCP21S3_D4]